MLNTKGTADDVSEELRDVLHYIGGEKPTGKLVALLDEGVREVKNSEDWRREYMTLLMRDREKMKLGAYVLLVQQIRDQIGMMSYQKMADTFKTSTDRVENIVSVIENNPDWDDEDIASELVEE